jgi:hypothetical protein
MGKKESGESKRVSLRRARWYSLHTWQIPLVSVGGSSHLCSDLALDRSEGTHLSEGAVRFEGACTRKGHLLCIRCVRGGEQTIRCQRHDTLAAWNLSLFRDLTPPGAQGAGMQRTALLVARGGVCCRSITVPPRPIHPPPRSPAFPHHNLTTSPCVPNRDACSRR